MTLSWASSWILTDNSCLKYVVDRISFTKFEGKDWIYFYDVFSFHEIYKETLFAIYLNGVLNADGTLNHGWAWN